MQAAHLENEINPFASAFCAPYAWSSRKGHWLRSLPVLLDMSIGRSRLEKSDKPLVMAASSSLDAASG
jgi:hypothetical protein